jgi:hypothetical protein
VVSQNEKEFVYKELDIFRQTSFVIQNVSAPSPSPLQFIENASQADLLVAKCSSL